MIREQMKLARRVDDLKGTAVATSSGTVTAFIATHIQDGYFFVMLGLALATLGAIGTLYLIVMIQKQLFDMMVLTDPSRLEKARRKMDLIGGDDPDF